MERVATRMSKRPAGAGVLPPYARFVDDRRGVWRRFRTKLMLRLTAKRQMGAHADVARLRESWAAFDAKFGSVDPEARRTPVDCGDVAAEWIEVPETRSGRVLLYFHGGAFMFRLPATHAGLAARWCRRLGARTLMVDYRLAPEHPFPAAADDCHASYRWLLAQGCNAGDIVIGGDSAGANLALVTLLRVKAAGEPMPACAVLMSPVVDFTLSGRSLVTNEARDPMFTLAGMALLRGLYAPPERYLDTSVSPLFADFSGLPPLLFQAGSTEMLLDESMRAAARADACGVPVELEIWRDMPHVFQAMPTLPQSEAATDSIVRFIGARAGWVQ
jgi:monoterpene epsilon-lactone hydrolase